MNLFRFNNNKKIVICTLIFSALKNDLEIPKRKHT